MQTDRDDASQNVRANETADTRQEANDGGSRKLPTQVFSGKALLLEMRRGEGDVRERLGIEAAEQVVHHRVADQHHFHDLLFAAGGDIDQHGSEEVANQDSEVIAALREANPAHHIGPMNCLRIQRRAQAKELSGREVQNLGNDRCGAQIDSHGETGAAGPSQLSIVGEHRHVPLFDLQL